MKSHLTLHELRLLTLLRERQNMVVSKEDISRAIWGVYPSGDNVKVLVRKLRQKRPQLRIKNKWGVGYALVSFGGLVVCDLCARNFAGISERHSRQKRLPR